MLLSKIVLTGIISIPAVWLAIRFLQFDLGANPVETLTHITGDWALRLLLITLMVTPIRTVFGWTILIHYRRILGVSAFVYALLHFVIWLWLEHEFSIAEISKDILKRPYVSAGFTSFMILLPLAITSTNSMMRRLGRKWKQLHRWVYVAATAGVFHYLWLVKADWFEPVLYGVWLIVLLAWRSEYLPRQIRQFTLSTR